MPDSAGGNVNAIQFLCENCGHFFVDTGRAEDETTACPLCGGRGLPIPILPRAHLPAHGPSVPATESVLPMTERICLTCRRKFDAAKDDSPCTHCGSLKSEPFSNPHSPNVVYVNRPSPGAEVYIGDGVYAAFNGFALKLRAPREHGDHEVFLEPREFAEVLRFAKQCGFSLEPRQR
jgi:DNA-directed RNA polymerase subunit RPC12/RpoP